MSSVLSRKRKETKKEEEIKEEGAYGREGRSMEGERRTEGRKEERKERRKEGRKEERERERESVLIYATYILVINLLPTKDKKMPNCKD